jgi:hypothetical protein
LKKKIKADPDAKPSNLSNFKSIIYIDLSSDEENWFSLLQACNLLSPVFE